VNVFGGFCVAVDWRVEVGLNGVGILFEIEHARLKIPSIRITLTDIYGE
jgi:hypothetical protein